MSDTIMGFIPKDKYVKITYLLVLASSGLGLLFSILGLLGVYLPLGGLVALAGLIGLVLGLLGFFLFKEEFSPLDQAHLLYLACLFGIFFIVNIILASALAGFGLFGVLVSILVSAAEFVLLFTGFNSWNHGRIVNKDNVKSEVQSALKRS